MRSPKDRPDRRCVWTPLHGEHLFVGMTTPPRLPPSPPWMTVGPRGRVSFRWLGGLRGVGWLGWARPGPRSVWTGGLGTGWSAGGAQDSRGGLGVVRGGLGADVAGDADVVAGVGLAPDVALQAGVQAEGTVHPAGGPDAVVRGGLAAGRPGDAHPVTGSCFAPDPSLQAPRGDVRGDGDGGVVAAETGDLNGHAVLGQLLAGWLTGHRQLTEQGRAPVADLMDQHRVGRDPPAP